MTTAKATIDATPGTAIPRSSRLRMALAGRLVQTITWTVVHKRQAALVAGGLILGVAALVFALLPGDKQNIDDGPAAVVVMPEDALAALDRGEYSDARRLASQFLRREPKNEDFLSASAFVRGASAAYEVPQILDDTRRRRRNLLAARFLEEARERGFPPGRDVEGLYLLGKSLVAVDRYVAARVVLREVLTVIDAARRSEVMRLLAIAYRAPPDANLRESYRFNEQFLAAKDVPAADRAAGVLLRADLLLAEGDLDGCRAALADPLLGADQAAAAAVLVGRVKMDEARKFAGDAPDRAAPEPPVEGMEARALAATLLHQAIDAFNLAQMRDRLGEEPSRHAAYLSGICLQRLGDLRGAAEQQTRTYKLHDNRPEGMVASLALAEILRKLKDDEAALAAYRQVLVDAAKPEMFPNPWISRDELRQQIDGVFRTLVDEGRFADAIALASQMPPIIDETRAIQLAAETHARWAQRLRNDAASKPRATAEPLRKQAAEQFRAAGDKFAALAELRFATPQYTQDLWDAATSYLAGNNYEESIRLLRIYLNNDARLGRAQALVAIGEAHMARGRLAAARAVLNECLELHPRDAACYKARILAAKALLLENKVDDARKLLELNLDGQLTPASAEWRDSLFLLGEAEYGQGSREENASQALDSQGKSAQALARLESAATHFRRAADTLEEAVQRFPEAEQNTRARYMWAEALRRVAKLPRRKLRDANIEAIRLSLIKEIQASIRASMVVYDDLKSDLNRQQEIQSLPALEASIIRNCYFLQGDLHFELGQFDEAIVAYKAATNRYQTAPEALHAFFQIAACYRRSNRPGEARGALEQAKVVLGRITATDQEFIAATNQTRADWQRVLEWMATL